MNYKNLNVPATLIHSVNGKKYRLNGTLLAINESTGKCSMKFGNKTSKNIPLEEVYLNEGALQKIKDAGKYLWSKFKGFVKVLGGLLLPITEDGEMATEFINLPVNAALMDIPGVTFGLTDMMKEEAENAGANMDGVASSEAAIASSIEREADEIETYWGRVMKEYAKNESLNLSSTIKMVNEKYYSKGLKHINEVVATMHNARENEFGPEINATTLKDLIAANFLKQLDPTDISLEKGHGVKPLCIWGAPGIGKTSIIKSAGEILKSDGYKFAFTNINCSGLLKDGFSLPDTAKNVTDAKMATETPKTWLPVYSPAAYESKKELQQIDEAYNSGICRIVNRKGEKYTDAKLAKMASKTGTNGGILFFDEISHIQPGSGVNNVLMSIIGDRTFGEDYILASHWVTIAAGNTLWDDNRSSDESTFWDLWVNALLDRFDSFRYVPTRKEWLAWARSSRSEDDKRQNVDEMFCEFIELAPAYCWYDALDFGGHDDELDNGTKTALRNLKSIEGIEPTEAGRTSSLSNKDIDAINSFLTGHDHPLTAGVKSVFTSRSWQEKIQKAVDAALNQLFQNDRAKINKCYKETTYTDVDDWGDTTTRTVANLDYANLSKMLDTVPIERWKRFVAGKANNIKDGLKLMKTDRLGFFLGFIKEYAIGFNSTMQPKIKTEWQSWEDMFKQFTPKIFKEIWTTGKPSLGEEDDILYPKASLSLYANSLTTKWKASTQSIHLLIDRLIDNYPGDMLEDLQKDVETLLNNPVDATKADIMKYDQEFQFTVINSKTHEPRVVHALISPTDEDTTDNERLTYAFILKNCEFARKYAHAMLYIGKIALLSNGETTSYFTNKMFNDIYVKVLVPADKKLKAAKGGISINNYYAKNADIAPWRVGDQIATCISNEALYLMPKN